MDTLSKSDKPTLYVIGLKADYIISSLLVTIVYISATLKFGLGATFDSVNYLSAASTVSEGMKKSDGTIFFEWPPLFPIIISTYKIINVPILLFTYLLNAVVLNVNILISIYILKNILSNKFNLVLGSLILILSTPLLQVHAIIWSEPIFILLILLNILILHKYINERRLIHLLQLILIGILLCLQRKSGIYIIAANGMLLLLFRPVKILAFLIYIGSCTIPILWWFLRRRNLSGKYFGAASWNNGEFINVLEAFLDSFTSHFLPSSINLPIRIFILSFIGIGIIYVWYKHKLIFSHKQQKLLQIMLFFVVAYYGLLIVSLFYIHISEKIDDRILSPVYLPLALIVVYVLDNLQCNVKKWTYMFSLILIFWLAYTSARTIHHILRWNKDGTGGYNTLNWRNNSIIQYLSNNQIPTELICTNEVETIAYHLNFRIKKNVTILKSDSLIKIFPPELIVYFKKNGNLPSKNCDNKNWSEKNIILNTKEGIIWKMKAN